MRTTLTDVAPANVGGNLLLTNQTWACLNSSLPVQGSTQISSRVFSSDQLNYALTQLDSRTIFVQQNFSFSQPQAGVAFPIVIANYRYTCSLVDFATCASSNSDEEWKVRFTAPAEKVVRPCTDRQV